MAQNAQTQEPGLKTLLQRAFGGLNLAMGPMAIADNEFLNLTNAMPYADGNIVCIPEGLSVSGPPVSGAKIVQIFCQSITPNGGTPTPYIIAGLQSGDVWALDLNTKGWFKLWSGYTPGGMSISNWQGNYIIGVDTVKGYWYWAGGTTAPVLASASYNGQCIASYAGHVWIAQGSVISYSQGGTPGGTPPKDFSSPGGSFVPSDPSFNGPCIQMLSSQGWLYLLGNSIMALNNVTASTTGSPFFITLVASSIGITYQKAAVTYDNTLLLTTDSGFYAYYGLTGQKISQNMGDNFSGSNSISALNLYGKTVIFFDTNLAYVVEDQKWFLIVDPNYGANLVDQDTMIYDGLSMYGTDGTSIIKWCADMTSTNSMIVQTKLFDCSNPSIDKQIVKIGVETYESGLITPPNTPNTMQLTYEARGFISNSTQFKHTGIDGTKNVWTRDTINLKDRYTSIYLNMVCKAGTSIAGFFTQFKDSTPWP